MNISIKTLDRDSDYLALTISGQVVMLMSPEDLKGLKVSVLKEVKAEVELQLRDLVYNSIRNLALK